MDGHVLVVVVVTGLHVLNNLTNKIQGISIKNQRYMPIKIYWVADVIWHWHHKSNEFDRGSGKIGWICFFMKLTKVTTKMEHFSFISHLQSSMPQLFIPLNSMDGVVIYKKHFIVFHVLIKFCYLNFFWKFYCKLFWILQLLKISCSV